MAIETDTVFGVATVVIFLLNLDHRRQRGHEQGKLHWRYMLPCVCSRLFATFVILH